MARLPEHLALLLALAFTMASAAALPRQNGDQAGERQPPVDRQWFVPPAPPLSPAEAAARFQLPAGYTIEAVATEPLVHEPVDIAWDERGRMWVVEMPTFMPDADGSGELDPACSLAVLSDDDGDGRYDRRQIFLDGLVLPRSVCFVPGGVVAILPPEIVFLQDQDGDGHPDHREVLSNGLEAGLHNPEHAANSLVLGLDNWLYVANHDRRYRRMADGSWRSEPCARGGQWGQSQDDWGRLVFNYNSSPPYVNLLPPAAVMRNSALGRAEGSNRATSRDHGVDAARVNTGVNRGYRQGTLTADGRLASLTATCGPAWFTGTALAPADRGRLFSCEPAANLVQRFEVTEADGEIHTTRLKRAEDGLDFLTSTDERFRPVNLRVGPDGALYVVDLYRGILQHRVFMTSYLRRQVEERGLDHGRGRGRIWRIRHEQGELASPTDLSKRSPSSLVPLLDHANAWQRRSAQRLLIEAGWREGQEARAPLQEALLTFAKSPDISSLGRSHAGWTLEGIREVAPDLPAIDPSSPASWQVQRLRLAGAVNHETWRQSLLQLAAQAARPVRWQIAIQMGEADSLDKLPAMLALLAQDPEDPILRGAILSGLGGVELEAIAAMLAGASDSPWRRDSPGRRQLLRQLAACVLRREQPQRIANLIDWAAHASPPWRVAALLKGMQDGLPGGNRPALSLDCAAPAGLQTLADDAHWHAAMAPLMARLAWADRPAQVAATNPTKADLIARGAEVYAASCLACHQADGRGLAGLAPPLRDSEWLEKRDEQLAAVVLFGLSGPIQVAGQDYDLSMPPWASHSDHDLAAVLSYVRSRWSQSGKMVTAETIAAVRAAGP